MQGKQASISLKRDSALVDSLYTGVENKKIIIESVALLHSNHSSGNNSHNTSNNRIYLSRKKQYCGHRL